MTCRTCRWWTQLGDDASDPFRVCVWHTGARKTNAEQVQFTRGPIYTREDFGCVKWEERKDGQ